MKYLSHQSALEYWKFPLANSYFNGRFCETSKTHYTTVKREELVYEAKTKIHLCSGNFPTDGLLTLNNGQNIVSPAMMYIQLVQQLSFLEAVILADLLCSCPNGPWSKPIVTCEELKSFAMNSYYLYGRRKSLIALNYAKNNACSIMEIFVDLLLAFPNKLGGLNIKGGVFNYKIDLPHKLAQILGQSTCFIDYCFPEQKIAYEYLGAQHNNSIDFDSNRRLVLEELGYQVITITKTQLYDEQKLTLLFKRILQIHGLKHRRRTQNYTPGCRRILRLLPTLPLNTG